MKTTLIIINKILALSTFPLLVYYMITEVKYTPKNKFMYFEGLTGFFNTNTSITKSMEPFYVFALTVFAIIFIVRWANIVAFSWGISPVKIAREVSYNVSNIIDIVSMYLFLNCVLSFNHIENKIVLGVMVLATIILVLAIIGYKIVETSASMENEDAGGLEIRKAVERYLLNLRDYDDVKNRLTNSYKDLINESN